MEHKLTFMSDGLKLSGVLHVPEGRKPGQRLPTIIVLHGFVGTKDKSHVELVARMIEEMGYCVFRIDFRGCGESEGARGEVRCHDQVADTRNALTFIAQREEVDPDRIGLTGHSFGAAVAIFTGGVDRRVACVISLCGWGDGEQTRSFCYIDDCVEGIYRLMRSDHREPLNLGSDRLVTINEMIDIISAAAGKTVRRRHDLTKPQGVRGRNSDNTRLREVLKWEPQVSLEDGLAETYRWIYAQLEAEGRISSQAASLA